MDRITINTGLPGFVMLERILERDAESIALSRHFSDAPLFTGVETLAQSGCIHVRYLEEFKKHAFLLKIDELNHDGVGELSGEYIIRGRMTGRSSNAYSYAMTLSLAGEEVMDGVFLFGTKEYDAAFRQDKISEHYRKVFSCLTRDL